MEQNSSFLFVDIDHTLCDASERDHLIQYPMSQDDWDLYHSYCHEDKPFIKTIDVVNGLRDCFDKTILFTSRNEKYRDITEKWLFDHHVSYDDLLMRPSPDFRKLSPTNLKFGLVMNYLLKNNNPINIDTFEHVIIDDDDNIIQYFQKKGFLSFKIHNPKLKVDA